MNNFSIECDGRIAPLSYSWFTFEPLCTPQMRAVVAHCKADVRSERFGDSGVISAAKNIILTVSDWYNDAFWDLRDRRVDNWPLLGSPLPILLLTAAYALFAAYLGPKLMKDRQPFDLRLPIICYNACMVAFNGYICYQLWVLAWGNSYSWMCEPLDKSINAQSLQIAFTVWLYLISKYLDWIDTTFFILRKKFDHLSGLHLYHHTVMPSCAWLCARFSPGKKIRRVALKMSSFASLSFFRWPTECRCATQLLRARFHAFLLLYRGFGTPLSQIFMVEKVSHYFADASIRSRSQSRASSVDFSRLRTSFA